MTRTSTELLQALRDPSNTGAWGLFNQRYQPIILAYARRCGLQPADAEDVVQEALCEFLRAYQAGRYDRSRGTRLRDWLKGIALNRVREFRRRQALRKERQAPQAESRTDFLQSQPAHDEADAWKQEWRNHMLKTCFRAVWSEFDTKTLRAFEEYALRQQPAEDVARALGMSTNAVYIAKSRVLERMHVLADDFDGAGGASA
jgi:RNA polymerase sigma-70 factor (ECF subfamily)